MSPLIYQKKKVPTCSQPVYFEDQPVTEMCVCVCVQSQIDELIKSVRSRFEETLMK